MQFLFALLVLIAPLYVWRFSIGGLPTNFLMIANFAVIGLGLLYILRDVKIKGYEQVKKLVFAKFSEIGRPMQISIGIFAIASIVSLFVFGINGEKLAQWIVLYAQPLAIFALVRYFVLSNEQDSEKAIRYITWEMYFILGAAGFLAIFQYVTLLTLPMQWWGNANEPKRAIAFFAHANAYALFATPLLALLLPDFVEKVRGKLTNSGFFCAAGWLLGVVGVFLSLSRGAWLGLLVAGAVYVVLSANKKLLVTFGVIVILLAGVVAVVPNLRYRVLLPFMGEKSSIARISLWKTAGSEIKDSPLLGKGVNGFSDNWYVYNTDAGLEHYNFPHNIFLNFWVDLGLFGMLSMVSILILSAWRGYIGRKNVFKFGLLLFILALISHGLIDIPYLKNDLALIFWLILGLSL